MPIPAPTVIASIQIGRIVRLPDGETPSAIAKRPVDRAVQVGPEGIVGDEQADRSVHGGVDKAVLHYSLDHYASWWSDYGDALPASLSGGGAFGENLSSAGWTEETVHLGDRIRVGSVLFEVSQARQPCFKLNVRHGVEDLAWRVQKTGRSGWYYRVLEPGTIRAGDSAEIVERPHPDWPVQRGFMTLMRDFQNVEALRSLRAIPALAQAWVQQIDRRLG
ncbi:MOSC domain-containing protein [Chthonobacter albigriseus]|uniref:MOSC domain-containing protein n=1 Tax=Chthonobacter albigriseus TaxID=1683161 RepID=UPI0015EFC171|nr:MOSC domain-containing protein [Chthonobacter albigriseus]